VKQDLPCWLKTNLSAIPPSHSCFTEAARNFIDYASGSEVKVWINLSLTAAEAAQEQNVSSEHSSSQQKPAKTNTD